MEKTSGWVANFLEKIDAVPLGIAILLFAFIWLIIAIRRRLKCPLCGGRMELFRIDEKFQVDYWRCNRCHWEEIVLFN